VKRSIERPDSATQQERARQQVRINPTDSRAGQTTAGDKLDYLVVFCRKCLGQFQKEREHLGAAIEMAKNELAQDERMNQRVATLEKCHELRIPAAEVVDPDRRINEDHRDRFV
jgi:hypothetical protein